MIKYDISVLITFYNQEKYVDRALESVMSQKGSCTFKVIIGDDGSTDYTIDKIEKWERRFGDRITHIVQPRNPDQKYIAGSRASRNRLALLKLVDTPYFIFLDGDDYWNDSNKLQIQYRILEDPNNKDCIGCAHAIKAVFEENCSKFQETVMPRFIKKERKYSLKQYWTNYYFHTDTMLFRSNHIDDIQNDLLRDFFNDNLITYSFMQYGKMYYLPKVMAVYCKNESGIWAGEKAIISAFRDLMAYDVCNKINKSMFFSSSIRNNGLFKLYHRNKEAFSTIPEEYKTMALAGKCKASLSLINKQNWFHKSDCLDKLYTEYLYVRYCLLSLRKIVIKE